mgnify:CR=1 FL=1
MGAYPIAHLSIFGIFCKTQNYKFIFDIQILITVIRKNMENEKGKSGLYALNQIQLLPKNFFKG